MATHLVINRNNIYKTWGNYKTKIVSMKDVCNDRKARLKGAVCKILVIILCDKSGFQHGVNNL